MFFSAIPRNRDVLIVHIQNLFTEIIIAIHLHKDISCVKLHKQTSLFDSMISQIITMVYFNHYPLKFKNTTMCLIELNAQKGL